MFQEIFCKRKMQEGSGSDLIKYIIPIKLYFQTCISTSSSWWEKSKYGRIKVVQQWNMDEQWACLFIAFLCIFPISLSIWHFSIAIVIDALISHLFQNNLLPLQIFVCIMQQYAALRRLNTGSRNCRAYYNGVKLLKYYFFQQNSWNIHKMRLWIKVGN